MNLKQNSNNNKYFLKKILMILYLNIFDKITCLVVNKYAVVLGGVEEVTTLIVEESVEGEDEETKGDGLDS